MADIFLENAVLRFNNLIKKPEQFLSNPGSLVSNIQDSIKDNYDFIKSEEENNRYDSLRELIIKDFDVEQIWQQIELQNDKLLDYSLHDVSKLLASKDTTLWFDVKPEEKESDSEDIEESVTNQDDSEEKKDSNSEREDEEIEDAFEEKKERRVISKNQKIRKSVVDDDFFKLDEMEKFLKYEEKEKLKKQEDTDSDEESVDFFNADGDDDSDEEDNPKYDDFFNDQNDDSDVENKDEDEINEEDNENELESDENEAKLNGKAEEKDSSEEESDEDDKKNEEKKSSLEIREERLKKKIEQIEDAALQEKSWQLKGEITAADRPQNSLLEEFVEFDLTSRPAPVITQETTFKLEDLIKQRIKDKVFDSVERKIKPVEDPTGFKKKLVLDQEKSKQSLAKIYEDEYLKQKEALDPNAADKEEQEPKEHTEIKTLMKSLFAKLDALSNFHFTPKLVMPELKVVNNLPAISMEEVAPVAVSDAALLAPEEIKNKPKGDLIGRGERTDTDKKRERRQKKRKQKKHAIEKQKKEDLGGGKIGNKFNKKKASGLLAKVTKDRNVSKLDESSKAVKSSTAFFTQLEDEVKGHINSKVKRKHKIDKPHLIAKKMKL